ncbi:MAG TPA: HDOD domain-containing protein [Candidatus Didemnitutus sp.]|jgi:HD-like signal output (HDOD) protein
MYPRNSAAPFAYRLTPDEVVRRLRHLPSAPRVLPRLKTLLTDPNSSMAEVVGLIRVDPGIAARVLQIGNSAYYSHGSRCYTVEEAVNRVGYDNVFELVANAVASQVLVRPLAAYGMEADQLWHGAVACALSAEIFAGKLELDRDIAYTIGLLHSVGMVAIDEWAFTQQHTINFGPSALPLETCETERTVLGFHNAEAGAALLRWWEFPAVMSEPVRWQYLPRGTAAHFEFACLLHVSKWLRNAVCSKDEAPPMPDAALLRSMNLTPSALEEMVPQVASRVDEVNSMLEAGLPDKSVIAFPNGGREVSGHAVKRNFIDRYA